MRQLTAWVLMGSMMMTLPVQAQARPVDDARWKFIQDILPPNASAAAAPEQIEFQAMQARAYAMRTVQLPPDLIKLLADLQNPSPQQPPSNQEPPIIATPPADFPALGPVPPPQKVDKVDQETAKIIAEYLKIDLQKILSIRIVGSLGGIMPTQAAVEVKLNDGRQYVGEVFRGGCGDIGTVAGVSWLVESNYGIGTLKNIAAYLGVDIGQIASVNEPWGVVVVRLKDSRVFNGRIYASSRQDELGYGVYEVNRMVRRPDDLTVSLIANYLGIESDQIDTVLSAPLGVGRTAIEVGVQGGRRFFGILINLLDGVGLHQEVDWLVQSNYGVGTLERIALATGVDIHDLQGVEIDFNGFQLRLKDGRRYAGYGILLYTEAQDSLGYPVLSVTLEWLVQTTLDPMMVREIARFLGIDPSQIGSIRTENDFRWVGYNPAILKLSPFAIDVALKDGRHYVGEISIFWPRCIPFVIDYYPILLSYQVRWLVESNVGIGTLENIAEYLGIGVKDLKKVYHSGKMNDAESIRVELKDGRMFSGLLNPSVLNDSLGYAIEVVRWLVQSSLHAVEIKRIADYLGLDPSAIRSVRTPPSNQTNDVLMAEVQLRNGTKYVGELFATAYTSSMPAHVVGDYFVSWLVESEVGIGTLENIAAALGVTVQDLVRVSYLRPGPGENYLLARIEVALRDGRTFVGSAIPTREQDSLGYTVYQVLISLERAALEATVGSIREALDLIGRALERLGWWAEFTRGPLSIGKEHLQRAFSLYRHLLRVLERVGRADGVGLDHVLSVMQAAQKEFQTALAMLPDGMDLHEFLKGADQSLRDASRSVIELAVRVDNRKMGEQMSRLEGRLAGLAGPGAERARFLVEQIRALLRGRVWELDHPRWDCVPYPKEAIGMVYRPSTFEYTQWIAEAMSALREVIQTDPDLSRQPWALKALRNIRKATSHLKKELALMPSPYERLIQIDNGPDMILREQEKGVIR